MSTTYQDGVTPLDAAHMNALQQKVEKGAVNGYPALDAAGFVIVPAAGGGLKIAVDTNLYRAGAGQLKTDGQISAGQDFCARQGDAANQAILGYVNGNGGLLLGSAQDTKLYRRAAGQMQTEGSLYVLAANSYLGVWEPG